MRSPHLTAFIEKNPGLYVLDADDPLALTAMLVRLGALKPDEPTVTATALSNPTTSCLVRVKAGKRSFIVKQSRPWIEKAPQLAAPWDRCLREADFYTAVKGVKEVADRMPRLVALDAPSRLLVLEDLGQVTDFTDWYEGLTVLLPEVWELSDYLSGLHHAFLEAPPSVLLVNRETRELRAAQMFRAPYQENSGVDLDAIQPGLGAASLPFRKDNALKDAALKLEHEVYLTDGPCLIHGNFVPANLLRTAKGIRVVDPQFGFMGRPEIDLGVGLAHFVLSSQASALADHLVTDYQPTPNHSPSLVRQMAGVEIIRRLLGGEQLPLKVDVDRKVRWLAIAREWMLSA